MATNEANVISAVCKNRDAHVILGEDAKLFGAYGDAFTFLRDYYLQYKTVPDVALLESKFGDLALGQTTAPTAFYLEELKNHYVNSQLGVLATKVAAAVDSNQPSAETLEKLATAAARLGKYTAGAKDLNLMDAAAAEEHFKKVKAISEANGGTPGISTGFTSIDSAYTTGMSAGHSIIVMGYTGRGKSMFADLIAMKAWEQGYKPMIVSLEMSPEEQMERIYAMMSSGLFSISDMSRGDIEIDDFRQWSKKKFDGGAPFTIVSSEGINEVTPNFVQAKIDNHRPDFVVLDYMQLMMDNAKTGAMTPRMLNLSREIKRMATSNGIPIMSLTAVTDEDNDRRDSPPVLSQVSWSHGIEYDANLAIAIHRHDDTDMVEAVGRKNRGGPLFDFFFEVDFNRGLWEEKFD